MKPPKYDVRAPPPLWAQRPAGGAGRGGARAADCGCVLTTPRVRCPACGEAGQGGDGQEV
eukprot:CAMPEP_0173425642 /NCGR_PEP_ID=MMETSP1357-20121228/5317_1 /TAXON_ID=77926 /ORGANISM="Hemiselmis rufescens, Strain PCC563" /LENGTH=59 /DNA_ID=CAMNT_0014389133 /DNA_START=15 /DNA_END=190 /DNA_ORIENTATION=+